MNEALKIRRNTDLVKLRELQAGMPRALEILSVTGNPPRAIDLCIRIPTARNGNYPQDIQKASEVQIILPERYPIEQPTASFKTPIFNPNVYASGKWCIGRWNQMEFLDLFVKRLMQLVALDPRIIDPRSPANAEAAQWYVRLQGLRPNLFPTVSLSGLMAEVQKPKIVWRPIK